MAFGSNDPQIALRRYRGVEHSIEQMVKNVHSTRGAWSPVVRFATEDVVRRVREKDYLSECLAIRYWVNERIRYMNDPVHVEWVRDPVALIDEIKKHGVVRADCDEVSQLIATMWLTLGRKAEFITASFQPNAPHSHVFTRVFLPKTSTPIVCDPVAGTKEIEMLSRIRDFKPIPLD